MKKIAINGFGRIGRLTLRHIWEDQNVEVVAINDLTDPATLAHLLAYDSAHGRWKEEKITSTKNSIIIDGKEIKVFSERDPKLLPWKEEEIDIVIEATGFFASKEASQAHIDAGAKKVVISAPAKGDLKTIVYNVNHDEITADDKIISAASCTTNSLAPIVSAIHSQFGIEAGFMTTIHAYTNDQRMVDSPHADLRRARAGAANIIPTSTGAAAAIGLVIPALKGKLDGNSMRVPVLTGSVIDFTFTLKNEATVKEINQAIEDKKSESVKYSTAPLVSSDIVGETAGTIFDSQLTTIVKGKTKLYKVVTWYDNESSYVNQLIRVVRHVSAL